MAEQSFDAGEIQSRKRSVQPFVISGMWPMLAPSVFQIIHIRQPIVDSSAAWLGPQTASQKPFCQLGRRVPGGGGGGGWGRGCGMGGLGGGGQNDWQSVVDSVQAQLGHVFLGKKINIIFYLNAVV